MGLLINQMLLGASRSSAPVDPYIIFEFSVANFDPSNANLTSRTTGSTWTQLSSSPNTWKLVRPPYSDAGAGDTRNGWARLFVDYSTIGHTYSRLVSSNLGNGTCKVLEIGGDLSGIYTLDRTFAGESGSEAAITEFPVLSGFTNLGNVNGLFANCTEMSTNVLNNYNYLSNLSTISSHGDTFLNCGLNATGGSAILAQIPTSWGGTYMPPSTIIPFVRDSPANHYRWNLGFGDEGYIDFNTLVGNFNMFTTGSVSSYAGVAMNRSRLTKINGNFVVSDSVDEYYYPCIYQDDLDGRLTWAIIPVNYQDCLLANESSKDMSGTLDYSVNGPYTLSSGTFDDMSDISFSFVVFNSIQTGGVDLVNNARLYNQNFRKPGSTTFYFKYFLT